jgi:asparagine synthase (glutamine-hydrolysing)
MRPEHARLLPQMAETLDEPVGDPAALNVYLICRAARESGVKVLLSGQGADELFGGYRRHRACLLAADYRRLPAFLRRGLIKPLVDLLPVAGERRGYRTARWAKRFLDFADLDEEAAFRRSYTYTDREGLAASVGRAMPDAIDTLFERHARLYAEGPAGDMINRMCFADLRMFMRGLNLFYSDRASMAASTEVRVPFVDREVVKAAFAIPGRRKIAGGSQKRILKQAAEAWLEPEIIHRPKASFNLPLRAWMRRDLAEMVEDVLPAGEIVRRGYLTAAHVRRVIEDDRAGHRDNSRDIWQMLTLDFWLRNRAAGH